MRHQRRRPACTSMQINQHICYSLSRKYRWSSPSNSLTLYLLAPSADNLCEQFGFKKMILKKISRQQKKQAKLPSRQWVEPQFYWCYISLPSTAVFDVFLRHIPCCSSAFCARLETSSTVPLASISKQAGSSILLYESHNLEINYGYVQTLCYN